MLSAYSAVELAEMKYQKLVKCDSQNKKGAGHPDTGKIQPF